MIMAKEVQEVILKVNTNQPVQSLKDLRKNVTTYRDQLVNLDKNSQEYNDTLAKLATSQNRINEINNQIRQSTVQYNASLKDVIAAVNETTDAVNKSSESLEANNSEMLDLGQVASTAAGGFAVLQGSMALLGVQSEDTQKTMVKLQASIALLQGLAPLVKGINSANLSFKAFNATLKANPLILIISLVASLASGLSFLSEKTIEASKANEEFETSESKMINKLIEVRKVVNGVGTAIGAYIINPIKAVVALINGEFKEAWEWFSSAPDILKNYARGVKEIEDMYKAAGKGISETQQRVNDAVWQARENAAKWDREQAAKADKEAKDAAAKAKIAAEKAAAESKKRREEETAAQKELADVQVSIEKDKENRINQAYKGADRIELLDYQITINKQLQAALLETASKEANTAEEIKAKTQAAKDYQTALREGYALEDERTALNETLMAEEKARTQEQIEIARQLYEAENPQNLTNEQQLEALKLEAAAYWKTANDVNASYEERINAIASYNSAMQQSAAIRKKIADEEDDARKAALEVAKEVFSSTAQLLGEETAAGKAAAIASTTISTYQGAQQAFSAFSKIPIVGPALGIAAAAAAIIAGLANVKAIASTKVPGTSDSSSATVSAPALPDMPEMDANFVETHNNLDGFQEEQLNAQAVLVVEDVNEVQTRVQVAESKATF